MKRNTVCFIILVLLTSCVPFSINKRFIEIHENVMLDKTTDLLWSLKNPAFAAEKNGIKRMQSQTCKANFKDWRLPTENEISALVNHFDKSREDFKEKFKLSSEQIWIDDSACDYQFIKAFDLKLVSSYLVPAGAGFQATQLLTKGLPQPTKAN